MKMFCMFLKRVEREEEHILTMKEIQVKSNHRRTHNSTTPDERQREQELSAGTVLDSVID